MYCTSNDNKCGYLGKLRWCTLSGHDDCYNQISTVEKNAANDRHTIEQAIYKRAAIATVKKLAQVMCGPAYEFERTLNEYKEYLVNTYHLENEFPKGQSED